MCCGKTAFINTTIKFMLARCHFKCTSCRILFCFGVFLQREHTTDHKRTQFFNITQLGQKTLRLQKDGSFFPVCNTQTAELWQFKGNMKNSDMVSMAALKG